MSLKASPTIRARLVALVLAALVPTVAISIVSAVVLWKSGQAAMERDLLKRAQALASVVQLQLETAKATLQTLAQSDSLLAGDLVAFHQRLLRTPRPAGTRIALSDAAGEVLLNTRVPFGTPQHPRGDLSIVQRTFESGQFQVSDLYLGPNSHEWVVTVDVPVMRDGHVVYDLTMAFSPTVLAQILEQQRPPGGDWIASIVDRHNTVVARAPEMEKYLGHKGTAQSLQVVSGTAATGLFSSVGIDGHSVLAAFCQVPGSRWAAFVAIRSGALNAALWKSLLQIAAASGLLLLLGFAAASHQARRIARSIGRLAVGGAAPAGHGVWEVDAAARALADAATAREKSDRALRDSEARFRSTFDRAAVGVVHAALDGRWLQANRRMRAMLGYDEDELLDRAAEAVTHYDSLLVEAGHVRRLLAGEVDSYNLDKCYRRKDGTLLWVSQSVSLLREQTAAEPRLILICEDLTARHELRQVLDTISEGFLLIDPGFRVQQINAEGLRIDGRNPQQIIGRHMLELWPEAEHLPTWPAYQRALKEQVPVEVVYRHVSSVHDVWLEVRAYPMPSGLAIFYRDVTPRMRAEEAQRRSETRLQAIFDTVPVGILIAEAPSGRIVAGNHHAETVFRHPVFETPDLAGYDVWKAWHPDGRRVETHEYPLVRALAGEDRPETEMLYQRGDGTQAWLRVTGAPIRTDGHVTGSVVAVVDIDLEMRALRTLTQSREELERLVNERTRDLEATQARLAQAQRMEALGQLAGGIAHDFNNVLQAVQGGGALIERQPGDAEKVRRLSRMILEAADRGASITGRLLTFAHRGHLRAEPIQVSALLHGMQEILAHTLGDGLQVRLELEPNLPLLLADRGQLETVLVNLATNARDAMANMGTLTLAAAAEIVLGERDSSQVAALPTGSYVRLSVIDEGVGMDAATLARASEPFFTTKEVGKGTGLGLATTRGFAEQSGGALHIESAPGQGTTVRLWFPTSQARLSGPAVSQTGDAPMRVRLLLVDDDANVREIIAEQMEAQGYTVTTAASGAAALALLDAGGAVDLLVSDLSMPGMDGLSVIREAQRRRPGLAAILLTGFATDAAEIAVTGAATGSFSLLRKPIDSRSLSERIAALLKVSPDLSRTSGKPA